MAAEQYTEAAIEVLELVKAGRPWEGRSRPGRRKHLNWLEEKGLVRQVGESWELTIAGAAVLLARTGK